MQGRNKDSRRTDEQRERMAKDKRRKRARFKARKLKRQGMIVQTWNGFRISVCYSVMKVGTAKDRFIAGLCCEIAAEVGLSAISVVDLVEAWTNDDTFVIHCAVELHGEKPVTDALLLWEKKTKASCIKINPILREGQDSQPELWANSKIQMLLPKKKKGDRDASRN